MTTKIGSCFWMPLYIKMCGKTVQTADAGVASSFQQFLMEYTSIVLVIN